MKVYFMQKKIMNTNINYTFHDNEKDITLVLLHGWGQNIEMMLPISNRYEKYFNTLILYPVSLIKYSVQQSINLFIFVLLIISPPFSFNNFYMYYLFKCCSILFLAISK